MKIVYFEWRDAFGCSPWKDRDEVRTDVEEEDFWVATVGFLVRRTNDYIVVCGGFRIDPKNVRKYRDNFKVPRCWYRSYKELGDFGELKS